MRNFFKNIFKSKFEKKLDKYLISLLTFPLELQQIATRIDPEQMLWLYTTNDSYQGLTTKLAAIFLYNTNQVAHLNQKEKNILMEKVAEEHKGIGPYYGSHFEYISPIANGIEEDHSNMDPEDFKKIIGMNTGYWLGKVIEQEHKEQQNGNFEFTDYFLNNLGVYIINYAFSVQIPLIDNYDRD